MPAQVNIFDEMLVDNFAGGGGASVGVELATGRPIDIAINHDMDAIEMHKRNHPFTKHYCENVWDVNIRQITQGRPVGLAWFSPDCKHFSKAKGGKPVEKRIRGLAWVAVKWAGTVKPRVIMLENVEEFKDWGPIDKNGKIIKEQKGRTFNSFVNALKYLGYKVEWQVLKACDYGAPTIRKRLFLIARCDGRPIVWPQATHGEPKNLAVQCGKLKPYRTAAEIIDWSIPCPSIFDRKKPLAEATLKRIAKGLKKFVFDNPEPFILGICQNGFSGDNRVHSMHEPLRTVMTKQEHCLVTPMVVSCNHTASYYENFRGQQIEAPLQTVTAKNGYAVVAPTLIQYHSEKTEKEVRGQSVGSPLYTLDTQPRYAMVQAFMHKYSLTTAHMLVNNTGHSGGNADEPLHTITTGNHHALVTSHLELFRNNASGASMTEPLNTIMTSPGHFAEVRAFLIKYYNEGTGQDLNEPLHTVTTKDRLGLVTIYGQDYMIVDICLRMLQPHELFAAHGFLPDYVINVGASGRKLPKSVQTAKVGNSVVPVMSESLVRANLPEICVKRAETMKELINQMAI